LKDRMQFEGVHIGAPRPGPAAQDVQDVFKAGDQANDDPFKHPSR
jgi:hypothetical protein